MTAAFQAIGSRGNDLVLEASNGYLLASVDTADAGAVGVSLEWQGADSRQLRDGDAYRFTIRAPSGAVLLAASERVSYQDTYPNGEDCDEFPCKQHLTELALAPP